MKMKLISYLLSICIFSVLPAVAENAGAVSGPVLGLVNKSAQLRALIGTPGAAYFGPAIDLQGLELAAVSSESGYAIALTSDRTVVRLLANQTARVLADWNVTVDAVSLSPTGNAAALIGGTQIEILSGLPQKPEHVRIIELNSHPAGVAVSDDGDSIAFVEAGVLSVVDANGRRQIATVDVVSDLRFRSNSRNLIYLDGSSVMMATQQGVRIVAGAADGISSPRAVFLASDRLLLIADAAGNDLIVLDSQTGTSERITLPCTPAGLTAMNASTLGLHCENDFRIHLVQLTSSGVRVLFVPEPGE
jgi:hypothetical protein